MRRIHSFHILYALCAWPLALATVDCLAQAPAPALFERAVRQEQAGQLSAARRDYQEILSQQPARRDALLGLARVARAQSRLDEAKAIYEQLLKQDASDADAINGLAWVALADFHVDQARAGFDSALQVQPGNAEALAGQALANRTYRYHLDISGGPFHNKTGTAWGGGFNLVAALDANQTVELGARRNSVELATSNPLDVSSLPSNVWRAGYRWQVPGTFGVAVSYENRQRDNYATEHRADASANVAVAHGVDMFGGLREGFGSGWRNRTVYGGAAVTVTGPWQVVSTVFSQSTPNSVQVLVLDVVRQGMGDAMWLLGASGSTASGQIPRTSDIHGRIVYPLATDSALLLTARRSSFNREAQVELGWRKYWN